MRIATAKMPLPVLSINGTSNAELVEQKRNCMDALRDAVKFMKEATPHGRDYVGDPDGFRAARAVHFERIEFLEQMVAELMGEALAIQSHGKD